MSETAVGHREKCNQLFKEHNRLLRISAFPFGYVTSEIVGRREKIEWVSYRVNHVIAFGLIMAMKFVRVSSVQYFISR